MKKIIALMAAVVCSLSGCLINEDIHVSPPPEPEPTPRPADPIIGKMYIPSATLNLKDIAVDRGIPSIVAVGTGPSPVTAGRKSWQIGLQDTVFSGLPVQPTAFEDAKMFFSVAHKAGTAKYYVCTSTSLTALPVIVEFVRTAGGKLQWKQAYNYSTPALAANERCGQMTMVGNRYLLIAQWRSNTLQERALLYIDTDDNTQVDVKPLLTYGDLGYTQDTIPPVGTSVFVDVKTGQSDVPGEYNIWMLDKFAHSGVNFILTESAGDPKLTRKAGSLARVALGNQVLAQVTAIEVYGKDMLLVASNAAGGLTSNLDQMLYDSVKQTFVGRKLITTLPLLVTSLKLGYDRFDVTDWPVVFAAYSAVDPDKNQHRVDEVQFNPVI